MACTANRLAVIDIDGPTGIEWIRDNQLPMPVTWTADTAHGYHYYYRWPEDTRISTCQVAPKLEIRAAGTYVVVPPSIHPGGRLLPPEISKTMSYPSHGKPPRNTTWVNAPAAPATAKNATSSHTRLRRVSCIMRAGVQLVETWGPVVCAYR